MHPNILHPNGAVLIVIDVQEAFRHVIPEFEAVAVQISTAVRGFLTLGVPVLVTEQYPKGLGHTAEEIKLVLPDDAEIFEKSAFSACGAGAFAARLDELNIKQAVICGLEAHICVNQTAHDLLDRGIQVHLLTDAVCSRFEINRAVGVAKMQAGGVITSSVEMALFELMRDAKHEQFKEIQRLIR